MNTITKSHFVSALDRLSLKKGCTIYLQTDLSKLGKIEGIFTKEQLCNFILRAFFDIIGKKGTLVVPTYTTQVGRFSIAFDCKSTPTTLGLFPEYVRNLNQSVRSVHPFHSFCAIGANKNFVCKNNGANDFGVESPFHRLHLLNAEMVTIGLESGYVVGNVHFAETMYAVPYQYNKLIRNKVFEKERKINKDYFSSVRHLNLQTVHDLSFLATKANLKGLIKNSQIGSSWIYMANFNKVYNLSIELLKNNPYCFLKRKPMFKTGIIPFDGITHGRDGIGKIQKRKIKNWNSFYLNNRTFAGKILDHTH